MYMLYDDNYNIISYIIAVSEVYYIRFVNNISATSVRCNRYTIDRYTFFKQSIRNNTITKQFTKRIEKNKKYYYSWQFRMSLQGISRKSHRGATHPYKNYFGKDFFFFVCVLQLYNINYYDYHLIRALLVRHSSYCLLQQMCL